MTDPERYGMAKPTLQLTAYGKDGKQIGSVRLSSLEMILKPKSPETTPNAKLQHHYLAYATTSTDQAVSEIPMQSVTDLENTIRRLHSDIAAAQRFLPQATPARAAAASGAATPSANAAR
jgi:hypothetical protein